MMICSVGTYRQRLAVAIHYRHDFHAFSTLGRTDLRTPTLGHRKGRVDKALFFVQHPSVAQFVGDISGLDAKLRCGTKTEIDDGLFCSSGSSAAACATAPRC